MLRELQLDQNVLWKQRYRQPTIYSAQLALANFSHGLAIRDITGVEQLYAWYVSSGLMKQVTHRPAGMRDGGDVLLPCTLSPDGLSIYYFDASQKDGAGHFVRIPFEGGSPEDLTPDWPPYVGVSINCSPNGKRLGFIARIAEDYFIYWLDIGSSDRLHRPELMYRHIAQARGPVFSYAGETAVVEIGRYATDSRELLAFDLHTDLEIGRLAQAGGSVRICLGPPLASEKCFLAVSTRHGFERPLLWNPYSGEQMYLALDGLEGDVIPLDWSTDGTLILLRQQIAVFQRLYLYDLTSRTCKPLRHPGGLYGTKEARSIIFGPAHDIWAQWESSSQPTRIIALDRESGANQHVILAEAKAIGGRSFKLVTFPSSDRQRVQGWLGQPEGEGPFPTIIEMHGGPAYAVMDAFAPSAQSWLDHGFAYLTINYRGSTGFGKAFQNKIRGNLGLWEVEDMVAARDWLVKQGIARSDQVFLTGWSYGGYLTLLALGKRPALWAGGMAGMAIADLQMNDEDGAANRNYFRDLMGGTPRELPARYAASSPLAYVEHVSAPVLIIQGRNDALCLPRQIEVYEARMRALGKAIEVHWFDGEHVPTDPDQLIEQQELKLRFAYCVLHDTSPD